MLRWTETRFSDDDFELMRYGATPRGLVPHVFQILDGTLTGERAEVIGPDSEWPPVSLTPVWPEFRLPVPADLERQATRLSRPDDARLFRANVDRRSFVTHFGDSPEPETRRRVAAALYEEGVVDWLRNERADALRVWQDVVGRFSEAEEPEIRQIVALASDSLEQLRA